MMRMNAIITILLVSMLTGAIAVRAQEPASPIVGTGGTPVGAQELASPIVGAWDEIKALPPKEALVINFKEGGNKKGKLDKVSDTALFLSEGKKSAEISRDRIFQIYRSVPKSRSRAAGIGAAVGGGLMLAGSLSNDIDPRFTIVQVALWTGLGALIGRGIARGHERVLIYEARR